MLYDWSRCQSETAIERFILEAAGKRPASIVSTRGHFIREFILVNNNSINMKVVKFVLSYLRLFLQEKNFLKIKK